MKVKVICVYVCIHVTKRFGDVMHRLAD